jgi:hypothetical protein
MTKVEARKVIWERLATTARADKDLGDWMYDEIAKKHGFLDVDQGQLADDVQARDLELLEQACVDVADIIERMFVRSRDGKPKNRGA